MLCLSVDLLQSLYYVLVLIFKLFIFGIFTYFKTSTSYIVFLSYLFNLSSELICSQLVTGTYV